MKDCHLSKKKRLKTTLCWSVILSVYALKKPPKDSCCDLSIGYRVGRSDILKPKWILVMLGQIVLRPQFPNLAFYDERNFLK